MRTLTEQTRCRLLSVALALAAACAFIPSVSGEWVFDDQLLISQNELIRSLSHFSDWWKGDLFDVRNSTAQLARRQPFYRPVVVTSYGLDWALGSGSPVQFHITNLLLHAAVSVLAFSFLKRMSGRMTWAFWASLIFAIHPTKAESVAWISGRTDIFAALFLLLSAEAYAAQLRANSWRRRLFGGAKWIAVGAALLSKEVAIVFPVLFFVELWVFEGRVPLVALSARVKGMAMALLAPALVVGGYWGVRSSVLSFRQSGPIAGDLSASHLQLMLSTLAENVGLAFVPADLSFYGSRLRFVDGQASFSAFQVGGGVVALVIFLALCIVGLKRGATLPLLLSLLLLAFALPTSQLIPTAAACLTQARFLYLPLLPLAALCTWPLAGKSRVLGAIGGSIVVLCFTLSLSRSSDFRSESAMWDYELAKNPTVPEVLKERVVLDPVQGGSELSVRRALCASDYSQRRYGSFETEWFLLRALFHSTALLPDGHPDLSRTVRFLQAVLSERDGSLDSPLQLAVPARSATAVSLRRIRPQVSALIADLLLRSGSSEGAIQWAARVVDECPGCHDLIWTAAGVAIRSDRPDLAKRWVAVLSHRRREQLSLALSMREKFVASKGSARTWTGIQLGLLLEDPNFSYRVAHPHRAAIYRHAPEPVLVAVTRAARASGQLDQAFQLFFRLSDEGRGRLVDMGWREPHPDRKAPFVSGTCALPSELSD